MLKPFLRDAAKKQDDQAAQAAQAAQKKLPLEMSGTTAAFGLVHEAKLGSAQFLAAFASLIVTNDDTFGDGRTSLWVEDRKNAPSRSSSHDDQIEEAQLVPTEVEAQLLPAHASVSLPANKLL